jgi:hypothetical protein
MVFGIGYFAIGPYLSGDAGRAKPTSSQEPTIEQPPIAPGPRKWNPVSPPQVHITVTPKYEEDDFILPEEFPPEEVPPVDDTDDSSSGAAGSGEEQTAPPVKKQEETTGGAFQGITGGGW